jgi:hypothetical protein
MKRWSIRVSDIWIIVYEILTVVMTSFEGHMRVSIAICSGHFPS